MTSPAASARRAPEPADDPRFADLVGPAETTRVAVVVPYDMALDAELWRWVPASASLHLTRTAYSSLPVTVEMARAVGDAEVVAGGARDVQAVSPGVCAYACTSGSFVRGLGGERELVDAMRATGVPHAVTTSGALLRALDRVGATRVTVATPYDAEVTALLESFLGEAGVTVAGSAHLGLSEQIWSVPYRRTASLVADADTPEADAVVVSCTNLPTYDLIAPLEQALGKPVVTANQATVWAALDLVGLRAVGPDQSLLRDPVR